jgi:hypothetical protein
MLAGTGQAGEVSWDRSAWTGQQSGQFSLDSSAGQFSLIGEPLQDRWEQVRRDRSAWIGRLGQVILAGQCRQVSRAVLEHFFILQGFYPSRF